jgi:alpha-galactosidase
MARIVLIGAGSNIFAKNLIGDCLCTPSLRDSEFALVDIDEAKLALSKKMIDALNESVNGCRARVTARSRPKTLWSSGERYTDSV